MSHNQAIIFEEEGFVGRITLNRPNKLNALNFRAISELAEVCKRIESSEAVRVVILCGNGKAFCAGGDIEEWSGLSATEFSRSWLKGGNVVFDALARLRQPVIAVLDGHVMGGGLELAACADLRVAEEHIKIGLPETGLGVIPGWSGTQRTVRRFGSQVVRRMALMGEVLDAQTALAHGLVDHVVASGQALSKAMDIARQVSERAPRATEITKMMIGAAEGEEKRNVLDALAGVATFTSGELEEGIKAYNARRKPEF